MIDSRSKVAESPRVARVIPVNRANADPCAHHRNHHKFVDTDRDPYNAARGFWSSHIGWIFYQSPEAPTECALEISRALKEHPELQVRMGVHSGPVSGVMDVNERANAAGAGMNIAKRVMDYGDGGHILLSKHVAEDLEQYPRWQPLLHDLGECEVKHGVRVSVVNLYTPELGNPAVPDKLTCGTP